MRRGERQESLRRRVSVIGLGRFGSSVARVCSELGYDVTAVDVDEQRIAEAADYATLAAQANGADEAALLSLGVDRSDVGVVGQGQNLKASVSSTLVLKRIGVPWVIAKAETTLHGEILVKVGADRIVYPERDAGVQVAHSLDIRHAVDYMNLTSTSGVARLAVPAGAAGQTVHEVEASLERASIILIQRGNVLLPHPSADERLHKGDFVLVAGLDEAIDAFADA
ncbi:MAG: TrkA family potassium uptake protein [Thermomicrobiales bacterium]|nr:TrkA family potassium uptake protein [Thermomicrobiales bacterium]